MGTVFFFIIELSIMAFLVGANIAMHRHAPGYTFTAIIFNGVPIAVVVWVFIAVSRHLWYHYAAWIFAGLTVLALPVAYVSHWWTPKRLLAWAAAVVLAAAGLWGMFRYDAYLKDITLPESFDYRTYRPFREDSPAARLDEPSALRLNGALPRMDGATALYPVYAAFAQAVYPESLAASDPWDVDQTVACSTTSTAYRKIIDGGCDIIFVAGPSREQEQYAAEKEVTLRYIPIGREAFVFFVHPDNPLDSITLDELRGVYSGEITGWKQLGVDRLGSILAFQRSEGSGSQTALERFVMRDTPLMAPPREWILDGMAGMVEAVSNYRNPRNAIGYSFRFYCTALMKNFNVKLLAVNGVKPTMENIESGTYPLASSFYAVIRDDADENTLALADWIQGPQGQELIRRTGYTPIEKGTP